MLDTRNFDILLLRFAVAAYVDPLTSNASWRQMTFQETDLSRQSEETTCAVCLNTIKAGFEVVAHQEARDLSQWIHPICLSCFRSYRTSRPIINMICVVSCPSCRLSALVPSGISLDDRGEMQRELQCLQRLFPNPRSMRASVQKALRR